MKTSTTHPLRVDWVVEDVGNGAGRIGATFAPGKKALAVHTPGSWDRDLDADLRRLADHYEVDLLVSLVEDRELHSLKIPDLVDRAARVGIAVLRVPVPDLAAPTFEQAEWTTAITVSLARAGRRAVFHCRGGLGRAGTMAACSLVALGEPADAAITIMRNARPGSIETPAQVAFVRAFARTILAD